MKLVITRSEEKILELKELVKNKNIDIITLNFLRLVPNAYEIDRLKGLLKCNNYDYILLMSPNSIDMLDNEIITLLSCKNVIAIGPKTKEKLEKYSIKVSTPLNYSSYGIVEMFKKLDVNGKSIIIARSSLANDYLKNELIKLGMHVEEVRFYDVHLQRDSNVDKVIEFLKERLIKYIIFTSASNVHAFFKFIDERLVKDNNVYIISIGPFTAEALNYHGISSIVAKEHTIRGIVKELEKLFI